jgi:hypothetical protein
MRKPIIASVLGLGLALALAAREERPVPAQAAPTQLVVALYAPSAAFTDAAQRSAYVQGLAKAIQTKTGITTTGKAFVRLADLKAAKPDFAIIEGQCLAVQSYGTVLATADINGSTSQTWALFTRGDNFGALKGKKLAFIETGCRDTDFLDNAMLASEARVKAHFAAIVGKPDVAGAVATVRDYKQADGVFAPTGVAKGLTQVFVAGQVPNPGFVQMNTKLPANLGSSVQQAVLGYGANAGINGWKAAASYGSLQAQLSPRMKRPIFAVPEVVGLSDQDVLVQPQSKFEQTGVRQHFWQPNDKR